MTCTRYFSSRINMLSSHRVTYLHLVLSYPDVRGSLWHRLRRNQNHPDGLLHWNYAFSSLNEGDGLQQTLSRPLTRYGQVTAYSVTYIIVCATELLLTAFSLQLRDISPLPLRPRYHSTNNSLSELFVWRRAKTLCLG